MINKDELIELINSNYAHHQILLRDQNEKNNHGKLIVDIPSENGIDVIDVSNFEMNSSEQKFIERLANGYMYARNSYQLDFMVLSSKNTKLSKDCLGNFLIQPIQRVITFANLLPDFKKLSLNDQSILIQSGAIEIMICSSSSLYDMSSNRILEKTKRMNNDYGQNDDINFDDFLSIWDEELLEKTIAYLKSMSLMKLNQKIITIYLCLILFQPERAGLIDTNHVLQLKLKYTILLKKQIYSLYGNNNESNDLVNGLINKIAELSTLNKLHRSYLNDADYSRLEPLAKSVLKNF